MTRWKFQRGEDIAVPLAVRDKTLSELAGITVSAVLKKAVNGQQAPPSTAPVAAEFDVGDAQQLIDDYVGWLLAIPAAVCATLSPGTYATNATVVVDGGVIKSDVLLIRIEEAT